MMPSHAADAAGMLNAAFQSGRPTLFFYPKSCLNDPQQTTGGDVRDQFVPLGVARKVRVGRDLTLVGWGNTVRICEQAADALETAGVEAEVIDLRSISPWDEQAVIASAEKTSRLIVVHEDNQTCGFGAEILSTVAEKACVPVALRRVTRPDTHVPFNFANQMDLLPSAPRVLAVAADLTNLDLAWKSEPEPEDGIFTIDAIGSGPADETVIVAELSCRSGDRVERGQAIAQLEATKSVFELTSPVTGVVTEILASEGETVPVGRPLLRLRLESQLHHRRPAMPEDLGTPVFTRRVIENTMLLPRREGTRRAFEVGMSGVASASGSRLVSNEELVGVRPGITAHDIVTLTGIETRRWATSQETAVSLAVKACRQLLDRERLLLDDIDLVICSTTSPTMVTPSMACQVLGALGDGRGRAMAQAFDISAACSGYLYALQAGYDYLQSTPEGRVLVITAEVLSPLLDMTDFDTAILFGDAASATVLYGESLVDRGRARLLRPDLSAKGEDGSALFVPLRDTGFIQMKGRKVFSEAVRSMVASLTRACERHGIGVGDLDLVVPHQANQRIIDAVQSRIPPRVYTNIREHGNTSSSSIPLCLEEVLPSLPPDTRLGLCAFGGGFTFGAGILQTL
jgi:2-oxoisovalerate dehydrogenase E1 component